jgi:CSLREA domain-containing protein
MKMSIKMAPRISVAVVLVVMIAALVPIQAEASTFVVNTTDDTDDGMCDSNHCSLREAIQAANSNPGPDTISFDIPGSVPHRIELCNNLPAVTGGGTTIDGTTEPDYGGAPVIVLEPGFTPSDTIPPSQSTCEHVTDGLKLFSSDNTVRGLSLVSFNSVLSSSGAAIVIVLGSQNLVELNYLGIEPSGAARGNRTALGIYAQGQELRNNVISANRTGILVSITGNQIIQGNFIGTDPSGTVYSEVLGNEYGITLASASGGVTIGGQGPGQGNVISGNEHGVFIQSSGNSLYGNLIGTDLNGSAGIYNFRGILIQAGASGNIIGGPVSGMGNVISGNGAGLIVNGHGNTVQGNLIGTNAAGTGALPNNRGILVEYAGASQNTIGGTGAGEGNLISGNLSVGVRLSLDSSTTQVLGNRIGTDISGSGAIPNGIGLSIDGSNDNIIGGTSPSAGNTIANASGTGGLLIWYHGDHNLIAGNIIRDNTTGVYLPSFYGRFNTITRNEISNNAGLGIDLGIAGVTPNDPGDVDEGPNMYLNFPSISGNGTTLSGTACPGCIVEIFQADDDPTGHGEGMTFLTQVQVQTNGAFSTSVSVNGFCVPVTATATDSSGNTSEFSENTHLKCYFIEPPFLYPIWTFIITVFGVIVWIIRRRRPSTPVWMIPVGGLLGGLAFLALGLLPNVQIDMVPRSSPPPAPPPAECMQLLDPAQVSPDNDAMFASFDNPLLQWGWTEELPDVELRTQVELRGPGGLELSRISSDHELRFSAFGLTAFPGDRYYWRLKLEQDPTGTGEWVKLCRPTGWRSFQFEPLVDESLPPEIPPEAEVPVEEAPPAETPPEPCTPTALALMNLTCRTGDDSAYEEAGFLLEGESATVEGVNAEATWWWILNPDWQGHCWVWDGGVETSCIPEDLRIIQAGPLPTEPPPEEACNESLDQRACIASGGEWVVGTAAYCSCPEE